MTSPSIATMTPRQLMGNLVIVATNSGKNYLGRDLSVVQGNREGVVNGNIYSCLERQHSALLARCQGDQKEQIKILASLADQMLQPKLLATKPYEVPASCTTKTGKLTALKEVLSLLILESEFVQAMDEFADGYLFSFYGQCIIDERANPAETLYANGSISTFNSETDHLNVSTLEGIAFVQKYQNQTDGTLQPSEEMRNRGFFSTHLIDQFIDEEYPRGNEEVQKIIKQSLANLIPLGAFKNSNELSNAFSTSYVRMILTNSFDSHQHTLPYLVTAQKVSGDYFKELMTQAQQGEDVNAGYALKDLEFYQRMKACAAAYRKDLPGRKACYTAIREQMEQLCGDNADLKKRYLSNLSKGPTKKIKERTENMIRRFSFIHTFN